LEVQMKKHLYIILSVLLMNIFLVSCSSNQSSTPTSKPQTNSTPNQPTATIGKRSLRVLTHDSFNMTAAVLEKFKQENNIEVNFIKGGDAGSTLNKVLLSKDNPPADVLYGIDNTFLGRALEEGIFEPYSSPQAQDIPDHLKLDPLLRAIPVDYGDVCLNYDKSFLAQNNLLPPQSLDDLTKPIYKSMLVVQNPATSSPGLAFLFTTIGKFGENGYLDYWKKLLNNDVKIVNDWETAYYVEFSRYGGTRPMVISYASSPAYEVIGAEEPVQDPLSAALTADDTCFRQIEFVGLLKGAQHTEEAKLWIDFMLSVPFQEDIPGQMYMMPVNPQAKVDERFMSLLTIPQKPVELSPKDIAEKREQWLKTWTENILR